MFVHNMNFDMNDVQNVDTEFMRICEKYNGCVGYPLLKEDMQIGNSVVRCETGRNKQNT